MYKLMSTIKNAINWGHYKKISTIFCHVKIKFEEYNVKYLE